jgi:hypothetical protein
MNWRLPALNRGTLPRTLLILPKPWEWRQNRKKRDPDEDRFFHTQFNLHEVAVFASYILKQKRTDYFATTVK